MSLEDAIKEGINQFNNAGAHLSVEDKAKLELLKIDMVRMYKKGDTAGLAELEKSIKSKLNQDAV